MSNEEILRFRDGQSTVVADLSNFPLTIYTWYGPPTTVIVEEYYKVRKECDARAQAEKTKVIILTDMAEMGVPNAIVRKALAENAKSTDSSDYFHCYVTSVPNSLIRGMVTALQWIGGEQVKGNTTVANMQLGLRQAALEFERIGLEAPEVNPNTYVPPSRT